MASQPLPDVTPEQYLEYDRNAERSSEYIFGEIVTMSDVTPWHALISGSVLHALSSRLSGSSCRVFNTGLRVSLDPQRGYVYPDMTVVRGPLEFLDAKKDTITNPKIAVEVLSPSTMNRDLGPKARLYWKVASLTDLIFIEQAKVEVEHWFRLPNGKWDHTVIENRDEILKIESISCEIPVSEIYDGVELPVQPNL